MNKHLCLWFVLFFIAPSSMRAFGQHPAIPAGMTHEEHLAELQKESEMKTRGDIAMGFDQDRVAHHFRLTREGGAIQVTVGDSSDLTNRDAIRTHLRHIAAAF